MQRRAMAVLQDLSEQSRIIVALLVEDVAEDEASTQQLARISPLAFDMVYCTLATYHWLAGERGGEQYQARIRTLTHFFDSVTRRWGLGREYLNIVGGYDVMIRSHMFLDRNE